MNAFKQRMERQLQAKREQGHQPPVGRAQQAGTHQPEEKAPAEMTPEELDAAIEAQRAEVRRLKESELEAGREASEEAARRSRRSLPFGASRRNIT